MKRKILVIIFFLVITLLDLTACETLNQNNTSINSKNKEQTEIKNTEEEKVEKKTKENEEVKKTEAINTVSKNKEIKDKKADVDFRKIFMVNNKDKSSWYYYGPIETGCILLLKSIENVGVNVSIDMRGYFYGGIAYLSEGTGEILDCDMNYLVKKDEIIQTIKNDNVFGGIIDSKIILKTPLELGNKWEETIMYDGKEYTAVSEIVGLEYPEILSLRDDEESHKRYVVETKVKGLKGIDNEDYTETRTINLDRGLINYSFLSKGSHFPLNYKLGKLENEVPYSAQLLEKIKDKYSFVEQVERIRSSDKKLSREGLVSIKRVNTDIDNDDESETVELFIRAGVDENGEICMDDGQQWYLLLEDGEYEYVLIDKYVQLGSLNFWLIKNMDTNEVTIKVLGEATASFNIQDFIFNKEENCVWKFFSYIEDGNLSIW